MTKNQQKVIGAGAALCLVILAAGWFLLVSPKKSQVASVQANTTAQQAANQTLRSQIAQLTQQQVGLVSKQVELRRVAQRIPSDPQFPALLRSLTQIQTATGLDMISVVPGAPVAATATTPTVSVPAAAASASPSASTASGAATSSTSTSTTTITHPGSAATGATYETVPVVTTLEGNYAQMVMFMDKLENLERLYVVKNISVMPAKTPAAANTTTYEPNGQVETLDDLKMVITGEVYVTSASTTDIDLPALAGATGTTAGTSAGSAPQPASSPAAVN